MSRFVRLSRNKRAWFTLTVALTGCNVVLGINEPEEVTSPRVDIYPWDGAPFDDGTRLADVDASVDHGSIVPDAPRGTVDALLEAGPKCSNVPTPDAGTCGLGCASLCALGRACLKNTDCSSGRCFGGRCTLPACTNGMKDSEESDVDCGGLCSACGAGRNCRSNAECTTRICTNGICQAPRLDASTDGRDANVPSDGSISRDGNIGFDASLPIDAGVPQDGKVGDADAMADADVVLDTTDETSRCEAGCPLCACADAE